MSKWINKDRGWIQKKKSNTDEFMGSDSPSTPDDDDLYGVVYHPLRHPLCGSKNVKVYRSMGKLRYYYCTECKLKYPDTPRKYCFKVIEADD